MLRHSHSDRGNYRRKLLVCSRCSLGTSGGFKSLLLSDQGLDSVVHVLDKVLLRSSETSLIGDVEDSVRHVGGFSTGSTDLNFVLLGDGLELIHVLCEQWKLDVDGSTESGTEVGWAGGDVSQVVVVSEFGDLLNCSASAAKSVKDLADISSLLHGNDSELILLIDPDVEGSSLVHEDSSARWPVTVETSSLKVFVTLQKENVLLDELLSELLIHAFDSVDLTLEISIESFEGTSNVIQDLKSVFFGDSRSEWEFGKVSSDTNTGGENVLSLILSEWWAHKLGRVHAGNVFVLWLVSMVLRDDIIEEFVEGRVRVHGSSISSNVRFWVLASREDHLLEWNSLSI